jgi:hypothetical protein
MIKIIISKKYYKNIVFIIMDPNFNWKFYLYANPDLKKENIDTKEAAEKHFLIYGQFENRKYKIEKKINNFDYHIYYIFNKHKYDNLNNPEESLFHYILYSNPNEDIIYNYENAIKILNFNWIQYLYLNQDLLINIFTEKDALIHFIKYGIKENRFYKTEKNIKTIFNWELYILVYTDLKNINNYNDALIHYIKKGIDENRKYDIILNTIFDKINKKKYDLIHNINNTDSLSIINKEELKLFYYKHWNKIGKYKKKIFYNRLNENKITSNFGIAVSLYIDDNTPKERIMASYICLNSIIMHFIKNKIILVIDYHINKKLLKFIAKLSNVYKNIEVFINNENFGIAKTKNICLKLLEKYNYLDYFCLLDDDIEIIDNFESYAKNIYEKTKIPLISNFNNELKFKNILYHDVNLISTKNYFGNILIIHKEKLSKKGYFNKFEYKWGSEHVEITKRYLYNTKFKNKAVDFRAYFNNSQIINNINTLHLHSINVDHNLAKKNEYLLNKYLKKNIYVDFIFNENEVTKIF